MKIAFICNLDKTFINDFTLAVCTQNKFVHLIPRLLNNLENSDPCNEKESIA